MSALATQETLSRPRLGACTLCGADGLRRMFEATDKRGVRLQICRCDCGATVLGDWDRHYSTGLYEYYGDAEWISRQAGDSSLTSERYRRLLRELGGLTSGREALDIGCGRGQFVMVARQEGWNARGIELSEGAVEICRSRGVPASRTDLFSDELAPQSFDLCTMFEVLEHLPSPQPFLARAAELTRPGGLVYMTVPNFGSLDAKVLGPDWRGLSVQHLTYFTPATLRRMARQAGLEVVWVRTRNLSSATLKRLAGRRVTQRQSRVEDGVLRETLEGSAPLRGLKGAANAMLMATGLGNSLTLLARRP